MGKLGQLLVARGWINLQQLTRALQNQSVVGGRLGTCLLESDSIGEAQLQRGLAEQFGVPAAEIDDLRGVPEEVLALIPKRLARRCRVIPFRVEGGRLDLAMLDPRHLSCQDEIAFATSKRVKVYVLHEIRLLEALERHYGEEMPSRYGLILDRLNRVRYLWQTPAAREAAAAALPAPSAAEQLFAAPPKIRLPPPLPELDLPLQAPSFKPGKSPHVPLTPPDPPARPPFSPFSSAATAAARPLVVEPVAESVFRRRETIEPKAPAPTPAPLAQAVPSAPITPPAPTFTLDPDDTQPIPKLKPPRPKTVELTPEERAALAQPVGGAIGAAPERDPEPAPPPAATGRESDQIPLSSTLTAPMPATAFNPGSPAAASPQTEAEALTALEGAEDLESAGRSLLSFLALRFRRVALFRVTRDQAQGWMIRGTGIDQDSFGEFTLGFDQPSLFLNLRQGSSLHVGPLPPMPAHRQLARLWGGELPRDSVMLPIRLRDRLVTVLYADGVPKGAQGFDLGQLRRLGDALAGAFERYAVAKRRRAEAS